MVITVSKFSKILQKSMPTHFPRAFFVSQLALFNSDRKIRWKNLVSLPEKIFDHNPDMKQFQKAYLRIFSGLNV